ncbi:helix-turn-helix domain-containing protein [Halobaculum litoreum]|uniref:Helix-turn-helix domain-containing protein n=1 Tax=Halobaculum litoreum TaxID=3031998 RepID=A0ABD5XW65_9EURY
MFEERPNLVAEVERIVPAGTTVPPSLWLCGIDRESQTELVSLIADQPAVEAAEIVDRYPDECLVAVSWRPDTEAVLESILETDIVVLSVVGAKDVWRVKVRSRHRRAIADFQRRCREAGVRIELRSIRAHPGHAERVHEGLTDKQREALTLAYDRGYFSSPRRTSQEEIAEELGISRQSLGDRLKRGQKALIEQTLLDGR